MGVLAEIQAGLDTGVKYKEIIKEFKRSWGKREIFVPTPLNQFTYYKKPIKISTFNGQVELFYKRIMEFPIDRRTRCVLTARPKTFWIPIELVQNKELKRKIETNDSSIVIKEEEADGLSFEEFSYDDMESEDKRRFGDIAFGILEYEFTPVSAVELHDRFMRKGSQDERIFAMKYGKIEKKVVKKVKIDSFHHSFWSYNWALKHGNRIIHDKETEYMMPNVQYRTPKDNKRATERLTEIIFFYTELDYYKDPKLAKLSHKKVIEFVFEALDQASFPRPTEIIFSRGLQLLWKIAPIAPYMQPYWVLVQKHIYTILKDLYADDKVRTDAARLLRAVGSVHATTGKKIYLKSYSDNLFDAFELIDTYCSEELKTYESERQKKREKALSRQQKWAKEAAERKSKRLKVVEGGKKTSSNVNREELKENPWNKRHLRCLNDLFTLIKLRNGDMSGSREYSCMMVRYWTLCVTGGNSIYAIQKMKEYYDLLSARDDDRHDYSWENMIRLTHSAEVYFEKWKENNAKGFNPGQNFLVETLNITADEMSLMTGIMNREEAKRREREQDKAKKRKKRQTNGSISNKEMESIIEQWIMENPATGAEKLADMIRKKMGKCSKANVLKVKKSMKMQGKI